MNAAANRARARPVAGVAAWPPGSTVHGLSIPAQEICEALIKTYSRHPGDRASVASNLERITQIASGAPEVDTWKVEGIKDALSRGTYRINPERIAEKLIHMDTALQHRHRQKS